MKGEDTAGSSFTLQAQNPSKFDLNSTVCDISMLSDGTTNTLQFDMEDTSTTGSFIKHHIEGSGASLSVKHPSKLTESARTTNFENKVQFLDGTNQYIEEIKDTASSLHCK